MYGLKSCWISQFPKVLQRIILSLLTCLRVTLRTSPTYMMRPWCRTMPTVMESSHTSDATYLSTWMPKSFSTNRPEQTQKSVSMTPDQQRKLYLHSRHWNSSKCSQKVQVAQACLACSIQKYKTSSPKCVINKYSSAGMCFTMENHTQASFFTDISNQGDLRS